MKRDANSFLIRSIYSLQNSYNFLVLLSKGSIKMFYGFLYNLKMKTPSMELF